MDSRAFRVIILVLLSTVALIWFSQPPSQSTPAATLKLVFQAVKDQSWSDIAKLVINDADILRREMQGDSPRAPKEADEAADAIRPRLIAQLQVNFKAIRDLTDLPVDRAKYLGIGAVQEKQTHKGFDMQRSSMQLEIDGEQVDTSSHGLFFVTILWEKHWYLYDIQLLPPELFE